MDVEIKVGDRWRTKKLSEYPIRINEVDVDGDAVLTQNENTGYRAWLSIRDLLADWERVDGNG